MPPLRRELAAGDHFSFSNSDPGTDPGYDCSFGIELGSWSHRVEGDELTSAAWDRWLRDNHCMPDCDELIKYQKKMLDMVDDAPEFDYELSLRDLAELPHAIQESSAKERLAKGKSVRGMEEKNAKKRGRHLKCDGVENGGVFIKMFFPLPSFGNKRSSGSIGGSFRFSSMSKVSVKPLLDGSQANNEKSLKGNCIEKQQLDELSRNKIRGRSGCYPFFNKKSSLLRQEPRECDTKTAGD